MRYSASKQSLNKSIGINKSSEKDSYYYGESDLRFFKENTTVNNVVGMNGFSINNTKKS
jgi:hypothetical protein